MKTFKAEIQVRGYELDGYGHVNHAVYFNYAEHARWRMIEEAAGGSDYFKRHGIAPVLVRAEADYREPCYLAEWIVVETSLLEFRKRVAKFRHLVRKRDTGRIAAELSVSLVCVDSKGKAVSLPKDFLDIFSDGSALVSE